MMSPGFPSAKWTGGRVIVQGGEVARRFLLRVFASPVHIDVDMGRQKMPHVRVSRSSRIRGNVSALCKVNRGKVGEMPCLYFDGAGEGENAETYHVRGTPRRKRGQH